MPLGKTYTEPTINQLLLMFKSRQINLEPGFQRKSVWSLSDRTRLIQSIVAGYPIPSIFLYNRQENGRLVYDVIDGKQRLETILMFVGAGVFRRDRFDVKLDLGSEPQYYDWSDVRRHFPQVRAAFDGYQIQTVQVSGELHQIIDLFVRINSTGKRLTSGEKRHAKFYESRFLREADRLVNSCESYLKGEKILTQAQIDRMRGTELFSELLMSIQHGGPINKKTALDRAIGNESVNGNTLAKISREFMATYRLMRRMFPDIRQTRFRNSAEFYSLFLLVWEMQKERFILKDKRRNRIAYALLRKLSKGADELRDQLRGLKPAKPAQRLYSDYLLTVRADTDSSANRERRRAILKSLLWSLYERKDSKRGFTSEQRRIIWGTDDKVLCARCKKPVSWSDFTVDHILAYAKGGKTGLKNAQPMHRRCNSSKGA